MAGKARKRPGSSKSPNRTDALLPLNAPFPGCCTPYPDARFVDQRLVELYDHHRGERCSGFLEPRSVEDWNAEVDARASGTVQGDER